MPAAKHSETSASKWGFPCPGVQEPQPNEVLNKSIFLQGEKRDGLVSLDDYDYVVVGSGCTALAFVHEALRLDPFKKIICLERGGLLLPTHFQSLSVPFKNLIGGESETYPWTLSEATHQSQLGYCHGYYPFFGGRSLFWSGWCPQPPLKALRGFPETMTRAAADPKFWYRAREVLNVRSTLDIQDEAFSTLQHQLDSKLNDALPAVPSVENSEPAMLAGGSRNKNAKIGFSKFCAAESLLTLVHQQRNRARHGTGSLLDIELNCPVKRVIMDDEHAIGIETNRGIIGINGQKTKMILCAGAIPNTTLLLNSIPRMRNTAGKRLTGHFLSHVGVRVPVDKLPGWSEKGGDSLEIAAQCLLGYHPVTKRQYQIQITAVHCPDPDRDSEELAQKCPDYSASAQVNQLYGSENHVLFLCAAIGEISEINKQCWVKPEDEDPDETTNIRLQYLCNKEDEELWSFMEDAALRLLDRLTPADGKEYWDSFSQSWSVNRPTERQMRIKGVVHEASSTFMGPEVEGGSVDAQYRPHGSENVYVTGAGLFPTAGAWNPTLPMCGFAQDLAGQLHTES